MFRCATESEDSNQQRQEPTTTIPASNETAERRGTFKNQNPKA